MWLTLLGPGAATGLGEVRSGALRAGEVEPGVTGSGEAGQRAATGPGEVAI